MVVECLVVSVSQEFFAVGPRCIVATARRRVWWLRVVPAGKHASGKGPLNRLRGDGISGRLWLCHDTYKRKCEPQITQMRYRNWLG